jgi:hypothetical protein
LHAAANKKPLPKVIDKMRKAWEVFGIMIVITFLKARKQKFRVDLKK